MDVVRGKLFSNQPKNIKYVHKDGMDLLSIIITMGESIRVGDTVFYDGVKTSDSESRAFVLKHVD